MDKEKIELEDIGRAIIEKLDSPIVKFSRSAAVAGTSVINPIVGFFAGMGNEFLGSYYDFKFQNLITGLSTGLNIETRLNELYNYINLSQENAVTVANVFHKTINAECPKVCVIYGLILAKHADEKSEFTQEELIVCKALENATEYDLINFRNIMNQYMKSAPNGGNRVTFPKDFEKIDDYNTTCDWCVYNRIFVNKAMTWGEIEEETLDLGTYYYEAKPARVLLEYIEKARQTWNYQ